jgi:molecular chaperone Hsp33
MKNKDFLFRGLFKNLNIRFAYTETTKTVSDGILIHSCNPIKATFLGQALTIASLLNPLLSKGEKYSVKWEYTGAIKNIIADVTEMNAIRGIMSGDCSNNTLDEISNLFGESGYITMMKFKDSQILNSGKSDAGLLDICGDVSFFMSTSDQLESEFITEVKFNPNPNNPVNIATGFMIQEMPGADLDKLNSFRQLLHTDDFKSIILSDNISIEHKLHKIITFLDNSTMSYPEISNKYNISFELSNPPVYKCSCNQNKMINAVKTLQKDEILDILKKESSIKISCQFCKKKYEFNENDLL